MSHPSLSQRSLDTLIRLAAGSLRIAYAELSVVDDARTVYSSSSGHCPGCFAQISLRRQLSRQVVHQSAPLVIPDLAGWLASRSQPEGAAVPGGSYLGVPVERIDGTACGTVSVMASDRRDWQAMDIGMLRDVASLVTDRIELSKRKAGRQLAGTDSPATREASGDVLCVLDAEARIIELGARAIDVWGYDASELVGKQIFELFASAERAAVKERLDQASADGKRAEMANLCIRKDGRLQKVYWTVLWSPEEQKFNAISRDRPAVPLAAGAVRRRDQRILIVDDYREIGLLVRTALQFADFTHIQIATNPLRALEIAREGPLALVIADLRMEPLNGVELLQELRRMPHLREVPFIIISGYLKADVINNLKHAGVTSFLAKPFRAADVVRHAVAALGERGIVAA